MKSSVAATAVGLLLCAPAWAQVGTVTGADGAPRAGMAVRLACPPGRAQPLTGTTDARGFCSIVSNTEGICRIVVAGLAADVIVYRSPTRYNLRVAGTRLEVR